MNRTTGETEVPLGVTQSRRYTFHQEKGTVAAMETPQGLRPNRVERGGKTPVGANASRPHQKCKNHPQLWEGACPVTSGRRNRGVRGRRPPTAFGGARGDQDAWGNTLAGRRKIAHASAGDPPRTSEPGGGGGGVGNVPEELPSDTADRKRLWRNAKKDTSPGKGQWGTEKAAGKAVDRPPSGLCRTTP